MDAPTVDVQSGRLHAVGKRNTCDSIRPGIGLALNVGLPIRRVHGVPINYRVVSEAEVHCRPYYYSTPTFYCDRLCTTITQAGRWRSATVCQIYPACVADSRRSVWSTGSTRTAKLPHPSLRAISHGSSSSSNSSGLLCSIPSPHPQLHPVPFGTTND